MAIYFRKNLFDLLPNEEMKIEHIVMGLEAIEKEKKNILNWIKKSKGTKYEEKWEEQFQKLCKEADEALDMIKYIQHKEIKQIKKRLHEIKNK